MDKESEFQSKLIKRIKSEFPGAMVLKNDPNYIQGIPDLMVLYDGKWAALECKRSSSSPKRPNQEYYISKMNDMSFAAFVYPGNEEEVVHALQQAFGS